VYSLARNLSGEDAEHALQYGWRLLANLLLKGKSVKGFSCPHLQQLFDSMIYTSVFKRQ
jgi:hypothetical protein